MTGGLSAGRIDGYAKALFEIASAEGTLDEVEDELFRFARSVESSDSFRDTLTDDQIPAAKRQAIVEDLLGGKATPTTTQLVSLVVGSGRGRDLPAIIDRLVERAAATKARAVAEVRSAVALTDDQQRAPGGRAGQRHRQAGGAEGRRRPVGARRPGRHRRRHRDRRQRAHPTRPAQVPPVITLPPQGRRRTTMAELTISAADITAALTKNLEGFEPSLEAKTVGRVTEVGDGIARVAGLPDAAVNELLEFEDGTVGLALNLDEESIGAVVLGDADGIEEGQTVRSTGRILSVPVGDALLGRVVNALGEPVDGKGPIVGGIDRRVEIQAPGIMGRQPVHQPLQTGIKAIDAMIPIGRGQRELIIGDRKTGKTTVAVDTILNQKGQDVKCIYVAIGQKGSTVANTVETLREYGAMDYTVVVTAPAADPAPFKYLAPYGGCAMGQHWMENGEHALVVYDDLSKQAEAYRQLSLLLRRPPGREAYPGDVFYLHSRLLERAAKLSEERGAGSLTALPVIETKAGDVSAYIPTNVISITDGQIYLLDNLFKSGVRPAVDVGISVSRVGGAAQIPNMKRVAGTLKLDLAQFRELEAFATFGSELDAVSKAQLERGYRLVELLKQPLNSPMVVQEQVVSIFAGTNGYLDDIPVGDVKRFEAELLEAFRTRYRDLLDHIASEKSLPEGMADAVAEFKQGFQLSAPEGHAVDPTAVGRRRPRRGRERQDAGHGVGPDGWRAGTHPAEPHPVRAGDEEDHTRHGADRRPRASSRPSSASTPRCPTASRSPRSSATWPRPEPARTARCWPGGARSARSAT